VFDRRLYHLVCVATYVLSISIIRKPNNRKDLSYLGMASGFFGKLSLSAEVSFEVPFEEVTELARIVHEAVKKYSQQNKET
jgi:hypothetical protein